MILRGPRNQLTSIIGIIENTKAFELAKVKITPGFYYTRESKLEGTALI